MMDTLHQDNLGVDQNTASMLERVDASVAWRVIGRSSSRRRQRIRNSTRSWRSSTTPWPSPRCRTCSTPRCRGLPCRWRKPSGTRPRSCSARQRRLRLLSRHTEANGPLKTLWLLANVLNKGNIDNTNAYVSSVVSKRLKGTSRGLPTRYPSPCTPGSKVRLRTPLPSSGRTSPPTGSTSPPPPQQQQQGGGCPPQGEGSDTSRPRSGMRRHRRSLRPPPRGRRFATL